MMNENNCDVNKFENKGPFDLYHFEHDDLNKHHFFRKITEHRSKQKDPKAFVQLIDILENATGSANGRVWVPIKGNVMMIMGLPMKFKDIYEDEIFPMKIPTAILETYNHFAPGKFGGKLPNDIICLEHGKKVAGVLIRKFDGFVLIHLGANIVAHPSNDQLRKDNYGACCLKEHCDKVPSTVEFVTVLYHKIFEVHNKLDTIEKVIEVCNKNVNSYQKGVKISINNPNADIKNDGAFWTVQNPKAYIKIDYNGLRYQFGSSCYDSVFYSTEGDPDNPEDYFASHEFVKPEE